ncbi:endo-alpha-mannosidase [Olivibacter ginsenosidimutans]|uniref:Endo-alpha-mannosidase n=1 Tax=Olivibacter ginsenosidimutans TaxID=1176537 RepID=A0ABP9BSD1_9SPHI
MKKSTFIALLNLTVLIVSCSKYERNELITAEEKNTKLSTLALQTNTLEKEVFCFYYNWYGTPAHDGTDQHWAHSVEGSPDGLPGGTNIGSNFYPALNPYSSYDTTLLATHMDMLTQAGVQAIFLTWWGVNDFTTGNIGLILDEAVKKGIKVGFQIEPYANRSATSVRSDMSYILNTYGNHAAFYRTTNGLPLFFIYDSYLIEASDWASLLTTTGSQTIRNTAVDAVIIGLWRDQQDENNQLQGGFDGFYSYFGSKGFTGGSDPNNWLDMQAWASQNGKLFIPCVAPGYIDERIRPTNSATTRERDGGAYYDDYWQKAIAINPTYVAITSFNEWHEGTQIEPAKPFAIPEFTYLDYEPKAQDFYLARTKYWSDLFVTTP